MSIHPTKRPYRLLGGTHQDLRTGKIYVKGDVVWSSLHLDEMFVNKFEILPSEGASPPAAPLDSPTTAPAVVKLTTTTYVPTTTVKSASLFKGTEVGFEDANKAGLIITKTGRGKSTRYWIYQGSDGASLNKRGMKKVDVINYIEEIIYGDQG